MNLIFFLCFTISHSFSLENSNIGKVYPSPIGNITPKHSCLRCLTIRPRPFIKDRKKYFIDIDGTICNTYQNDYYLSTPKPSIIEYFNKLYNEGNEIHYWTARGSITGKNWDKLTVKQLKLWDCKYDTINIGKPNYDVWVDSKSINIKDIRL